MKVSVIIATHNRCPKLLELMAAIVELEVPQGSRIEVLVIDNGSEDETGSRISEVSPPDDIEVRYILESRRGKSNALNTGIRKATGDILAFTDDDCIPSKDWIRHIVAEFVADPDLAVLGGRVELYDKRDVSQAVSLSRERVAVCQLRQICSEPIIMGGNMAWRLSAVKEIPAFDPVLGPGAVCMACEDMDVVYRLHQQGCRMVYSPGVLVFHNHGRRTQAEEDAVSRAYSVGRGGLYWKYAAGWDLGVLGAAWREIYGLVKTVSKGLVVRLDCRYQKIALPALFLGAYYYASAHRLEPKDTLNAEP